MTWYFSFVENFCRFRQMQDFRCGDQLCKGGFPEKSRRVHSWIYQKAGTLRGNRYFCGPCRDADVTESLADDGNGVEIETQVRYLLWH